MTQHLLPHLRPERFGQRKGEDVQLCPVRFGLRESLGHSLMIPPKKNIMCILYLLVIWVVILASIDIIIGIMLCVN